MKRRSILLVVSCSGVWVRDFIKKRHPRIVGIWETFGARGVCYLAG